MGIPGKRGRATGAGFTLIELVLTIALILLLVGASVLNFGSLQRGAQLDEGVGQMEFLFRLARATAAGTGRQVRVSFAGDPNPGGTNAVQGLPAMEGIQVTWEPDPLGAPGRFHPLPEATPLAERLNDLIQCRATPAIPAMNESGAGSLSVGLPPAGSAGEPSADGSTDGIHPPAVLFYPDGSSDLADLILISVDPEDTRRVRIRLAGLTGTVRRQWLTPEGDPGENTEMTPPDGTSTPAGAASGVQARNPGSP